MYACFFFRLKFGLLCHCPEMGTDRVPSIIMSYIRFCDVTVPRHVLFPLVNREQELTLQHPPVDPSCTLQQVHT